jgi:hypothetical protein
MEYTDEGDPIPHDENPSWDPDGMILKQHFNAAKAIWEAILPGPGDYDFDFHWDDDISGLGLYTTGIDDFIEINPTPSTTGGMRLYWFADPTPNDNIEFSAGTQTLFSGLSAFNQSFYFPGTAPPGALETGFLSAGIPNGTIVNGTPLTTASASGEIISGSTIDASTGSDLLTTIVHEIGHALGINGVEPGEYNIFPQHVGGLNNVLVLEGDGGHLSGGPMPPGSTNIVPGFLICDGCGISGFRRFATATDVLVIAEDQGITDVYLQRVGRIDSGLWDEPNNWIGGDTPGFPQDVYVTHGGAVTLAANASAKDLSVAESTAVPEPGSLVSLLAGVFGLGAWRNR